MANPTDYTDYAFIAIGANLPSIAGNPAQTIEWAFNELTALSAATALTSSLYITAPVDSPAGTPDFHNAVVGILPVPDETPLSLLHKLQAIENKAGRTRSGIRNEARTLDLDLITCKKACLDTGELILPHPRAHERKFVLEPLMEITGGGFRLPGFTETIAEQLARIPVQQKGLKK